MEKRISHKVVVTVPVFNEEMYLQETLESIQRQTYTDFRVLISDNCSTDRTGEIARSFCESDPRFTYYRQNENIGSFRNGQFLFDSVEAEYIMSMGGHDTLSPLFLEKHVAALDDNPEVTLSYSRVAMIKPDGSLIIPEEIPASYLNPSCDPIQRYVLLMKEIKQFDCQMLNQLIRKRCIDSTKARPVYGNDICQLGHLIACGPFNRISQPLYFSRFNRVPYAEYLAKVTGEVNNPDSTAKPDVSLFMVDCISDICSHPNLTEQAKPAMIWLLLNHWLNVQPK